jgi:hypothetical protein
MRSVWAFGVIALVLGSLNSPRCAADDAPGFRVATFRCDATPPLGSPTYGGKPLETIETPLLAKGIVLEAAEQRYVLCAVDWCGLCGQAHDLFRRGIAQGADTDISRVAVHTVHQHTAPYISVGDITIRDRHGNPPQGVDPQVVRDVAARLEQAVSASLETLQPFDTVGHGQAKVDRVASARRIWKDGKILTRWSSCTDPALRAEPEGNIDPMLKTITLAAGKKPLVRIHYYTTHPQSFYGDPRVCYDVPGFARERLEEQEGVFQIYFTGCAGDVVMGKYNDRTPQARSELTDRLFAGMQASIQATAFAPVNRLAWRSIPLSLPPKQDADTAAAEDSEPNADAEAADKQRMKSLRAETLAAWLRKSLDVSQLEIGPVQIVHLPGECLIEFQHYIRELEPSQFIAVAAYGDLAPGYICQAQAFEEGGYEPSASNVKPESETVLKAAIRQLLTAN